MSSRVDLGRGVRLQGHDWFPAMLLAGAVAVGATAVWMGRNVLDPALPRGAWQLVAAGVLLGLWLAGVAAYVAYHRPLRRVATLCLRLTSGDLSPTVDESGPQSLKAIARVLNSILADFQEVLLLFVVLLDTARTSMRLLQEHADEHCDNTVRSLTASVLGDLSQLRGIIGGFKYYRVRIEDGTLTHTCGHPHLTPIHQTKQTPSPRATDPQPPGCEDRKRGTAP